MRLSLKRSLTWVVALVLLQLVVYYWSLKRPRRLPPKLTLPRYTQTHPSNEGTCSFKTCPAVKEGYLNVHIVPHSHTDVGWLKTVDQYYTGEIPADIGQELGCVRCTLESTIRELEKNKDRRFVFIEMKYFSRYWNEIKDSERELIRTLIRERRLELVGGGWVMSDAGVTMYNDIIDQHTLGFDFIADTFGPCAQTRTGWHVDQFGHSREHASIFAQMGFDSLFVSRIDFEDLAERKRTKNMEFVWYTSPLNLRNRSSLFTQVTYDGYYAPNGYVFDSGSSSSLKVSELDAVHFLKIIKLRAQSYKSKHILVPMGSDFGYKNAETWFQYLDPLIKAANEIGSPGFQINFLYSTPSCYTYYVNKEKLTYEMKKDDFLPYSVPPSAFWTGYYTTRGGFKKFVKLAGQILQACKQISIFMDLTDSFYHVNALRDAMGIMQHHDAVTGTQKKHVLKDYCQLLSNGTHECQYVLSQAYRKFWGVSDSDVPYVTSLFCPDLNISSCPVTEGRSQFLVTLYNTLSWPVSIDVRFPVQFKQMTVTNWNGDEVSYQIVPVHEHIKRIPERVSNVDSELVMLTRLPPMSISTFVVKPHEDEVATVQYEDNYGLNKHLVIENEHLSLTFDTSSGLLVRMTNKDIALTESVSQDFNYYEAQQDIHRFSGAYVFIPKHPATIRVSGEKKVNLRLVKGPLVQEIHQTFSPWVSQVVRLYKGSKHVEFQWTVGPIDDSDRQGKEVIAIFTTSIVNSDTFYTDSNGRELMERVEFSGDVADLQQYRPLTGNKNLLRIVKGLVGICETEEYIVIGLPLEYMKKDVRDTWNYQPKDHVSGNYYPVTSRIIIRDPEKNVQFTVLPDRPQGGSSLGSGVVELMVHRKLLNDDGLGVGEALNDVGSDKEGVIYTGKHYVVLDTIDRSASLVKRLALQTHLAPAVMFTSVDPELDVRKFMKQEQFLTNQLPDNVQVLTLDRISTNESSLLLLRLEHVFEEKEHPLLSLPVEVSLENLFKPFDIVSAVETSLGGNFLPSELKRLQWKAFNDLTSESISSPDYRPNMSPPFLVTLRPMEIRTFHVQIIRND